MNGADSFGERSIALFLLALLLFGPPILPIFSSSRLLLGIPLLYLYIFAAWAIVIALIALNAASRRPQQGDREGPPPPVDAGREEG